MILDPHIHSTYSSDSTASPRNIVKKAREIGLDAIAVADHNTIKGALATMEEAKDFKDFVVVPAMEISSNKGHIVALGIKKMLKRDYLLKKQSKRSANLVVLLLMHIHL